MGLMLYLLEVRSTLKYKVVLRLFYTSFTCVEAHTFLFFCLPAEDGSLVRIALCKSSKTAADCWKSLLKGQYEADLVTFDAMQKKMTLERFQREVGQTVSLSL